MNAQDLLAAYDAQLRGLVPARAVARCRIRTTLPAWRGRGIYRALVAQRANLAEARGYRYLQVDASENSRPILERLGFAAGTTTTPFIWTPPDS